MAALGLCCCQCFSLVAESRGYSAVVRGFFTVVSSPVAEYRLWSAGSVVVAHRLSCPVAGGIFLDQGLNPCLLGWQVDS